MSERDFTRERTAPVKSRSDMSRRGYRGAQFRLQGAASQLLRDLYQERPKSGPALATVSLERERQGKEDEMAGERVRGIHLHGDAPQRLALSDGSRLLLDCETAHGPIGWRRLGWRREGRHGGVTNVISLAEAIDAAGDEYAHYIAVRTRAEAAWMRAVADWYREPADRAPDDRFRQRHRRGQHGPDQALAFDNPEPAGHVEAGRRDRDDPGETQLLAFGGPQRGAAAERVAGDHRAAIGCEVPGGGLHEAVELGKDRLLGVEVGRGAIPREIEGHGPPVAPPQQVEHDPPGVGAVRPAVEQKQRRALPVELECPGLEPTQGQPV